MIATWAEGWIFLGECGEKDWGIVVFLFNHH